MIWLSQLRCKNLTTSCSRNEKDANFTVSSAREVNGIGGLHFYLSLEVDTHQLTLMTSFLMKSARRTGPTEAYGHPGQANNLQSLQTDI
jgi:hypothetical protein